MLDVISSSRGVNQPEAFGNVVTSSSFDDGSKAFGITHSGGIVASKAAALAAAMSSHLFVLEMAMAGVADSFLQITAI